MLLIKKTINLIDNYLIARWQNRPSTALFWYLPEPPTITSEQDLLTYRQISHTAPRYLIDYREKLNYRLENEEGIIVLPYDQPIGQQINPEAAFQYALGLHDMFCITHKPHYLKHFLHYAKFFLQRQTNDGLWHYDFDWFGSKAPWHSALAQARGASVMLRAWLQSKDPIYLNSAELAFAKFNKPIEQGGFLCQFSPTGTTYFEEYPNNPTGVINGFMASLISIWDLAIRLNKSWLNELWVNGIFSLQKMLPFYTTSWWSLYDLDPETPIKNVNSPRYHLLELHYLQILSLLSSSNILHQAYQVRLRQYHNRLFRQRAFLQKFLRKLLYK